MEEDLGINMQQKTRCFIAINFPLEIINEIERMQKELERQNLLVGKFTEPENLHLTLKFLGEISEEEVERVRLKLRKVDFEKFEAGVGEIGVFSPKFIRIIWIKVLGEGILKLQKQIDNVLKDLFEPEKRFMSHLTIARVKKVRDRKLFLEELGKIKVDDLKFNVGSFYLMKSELKPHGPVYSVIEEYKF